MFTEFGKALAVILGVIVFAFAVKVAVSRYRERKRQKQLFEQKAREWQKRR